MGGGASVVHNARSVVVVGGGYAGVAFVSRIVRQKWLRRFKRIVLVDRRDSLHHCVAACRAVVVPRWDGKLFLPYASLVAHAEKQAPGVLQFMHGTATSVSDGRVDVVSVAGELQHVDFGTQARRQPSVLCELLW